MSVSTIQLRVICVNPPAGIFGLQDKNRDVVKGEPFSDTAIYFDFELNIKQADNGQPNFTGQFAHGSVKERFVYLTLKSQISEDETHIVKRIKVHLKSIQWEQVEAVLNSPDHYLEVQVDGRGAASVPLLGEGWILKDSTG